MQEQRVNWYGLDWFGRDEAAQERPWNQIDGCSHNRRIPVVLVNRPETEAHGMEIQVLSHGVMMVPVFRRVLIIGAVDGNMVMVGMRLMRHMRFGMKNIGMPMWRDLEQVRQSQSQDHARPERKRKS